MRSAAWARGCVYSHTREKRGTLSQTPFNRLGTTYISATPIGIRLVFDCHLVSSMKFVGVDPGYSTGGIVILDDGCTDPTEWTPNSHWPSTDTAACWVKLNRKSGPVWRVDVERFASPLVMERRYFGTFWEIIDALWGSLSRGPYHLAVEQPFIPRRAVNGLVRMIEATGGLMAVWAPGALTVHRPRPNEWRADILNLGHRTKAAQAEAEAIEWAKKNVTLGKLQTNGHVAEAAVIARWCQNTVLSRTPTRDGQ